MGLPSLGPNDCAATGLKARLIANQEPDGRRFISAIVTGKQPKDLMCHYIYMPVTEVVSIVLQDLVGENIPTTLINAYEKGADMELTQFIHNDR